ncbi:MAG: fibronectin type III domain-containing protein [Kiritimatiellae bacterium]|nr:fibronectin type III domain-containing protein [Kiritimatiellia bacterium]
MTFPSQSTHRRLIFVAVAVALAAVPSGLLAGNPDIGIYTLTMSQSDFDAVNSVPNPGEPKVKKVCTAKFKYPGDSTYRFSVQCQIRNHGRRAVHQSLKRSFRLRFQRELGPARLNYPVFERAPLNPTTVANHDNIVLRGQGNEHWRNNPRMWLDYITCIRDAWTRNAQIAMSGVGPHGSWAHLYVNGTYWGLYNVCERPDAAFAAIHLGGGKDDWASKRDADGSLTRYDTMVSLARQGQFDQVKDYLDIEPFIDYILLNWYTGMGDWSESNHWNVQRNTAGGKAYFFAWDGEFAFKSKSTDSRPVVVDWSGVNLNGETEFDDIWDGLIGSSAFRTLVNQRAWKHLKNDGALTDAHSLARWDTLKSFIRADMQQELDRWGAKSDTGFGTDSVSRWSSDCDTTRASISGRASKLFSLMKNKGWVTSTDPNQTPPAAPSGLAASATSSSEIKLTWTDNSSDETTFKIDRRQSGADTWIRVAEPAAGTTIYTDGGLPAATKFYYMVKASNSAGDSGYSTVADATTGQEAPAQPGALAAAAVGPTEIRVTWTDNSSNEEGFRLRRSDDGFATSGIAIEIAANATAYSDTGLTAGTTYSYKIKAVHATAGDSAYTPVVSATTGAGLPAAPSGLAATVLSATEVRLTWTDNADNEDLYKVYRSPDPGSGWVRIGTLSADATVYADAGLSPGSTHYYKVRCENAAGNSPYTPVVSATLPADPGGPWRYRRGTAEASSPAAAWRALGFDDSAWTEGDPPFGYSSEASEGPFGTTLADMQDRYTSLFLRKTFQIVSPALVSELSVQFRYDDGFVAWINGEEIARVNVGGAAGDPVAFDALAASQVEPLDMTKTLKARTLPQLAAGANVLAIHVFNGSVGSSDLVMDAVITVVEGSALSADDDADRDGMADSWEEAHLGGVGAETTADADGDGVSNAEEYVAGTDPGEDTQWFGLQVTLAGGDTLRVRIPTIVAAGSGYEGFQRLYALEQCPASGREAWSDVAGFDRIAATGGDVVYSNSSAGASGYYRARVWLED